MRTKYFLPLGLVLFLFSCSNDDINNNSGTPDSDEICELPDWYYSGGELGTTFLSTSNAFEQPTKVIQSEGMYQSFKNGEALFEKSFNSNNSGVRHGLGPAYVRSSCIHCHPGYGHGKRQEDGTFNSTDIGNGYLLVVYDKDTEA